MMIIYFILFYWLFSYLFLIAGIEYDKKEIWYDKVIINIILCIIGGFLFPIILGKIALDVIKRFKTKNINK